MLAVCAVKGSSSVGDRTSPTQATGTYLRRCWNPLRHELLKPRADCTLSVWLLLVKVDGIDMHKAGDDEHEENRHMQHMPQRKQPLKKSKPGDAAQCVEIGRHMRTSSGFLCAVQLRMQAPLQPARAWTERQRAQQIARHGATLQRGDLQFFQRRQHRCRECAVIVLQLLLDKNLVALQFLQRGALAIQAVVNLCVNEATD